ncbi:Serine/arginine repetitive matrix protein 1, partial [Coemansia sp. IMI 209127]
MSGGFYIGTSIEQDTRFGDASKRLLKQTEFSSILKKPVDMAKVNFDAIKPWISERIKELLGLEDEVLYEFIVNMLEESPTPDPKLMQVNLTGFLESTTQEFMQSLWKVLLEAQRSPGGIPESFIQQKIDELKRNREQEDIIKANIAIANRRMNGQNTAKSAQKAACFQDFAKCDQTAEEQALKRLTIVAASDNGTKVVRADIEFALGLANQTNKLFSKNASGIRKHCETPGSSSPEKDGIQRIVRVAVAAFKFLHTHRSTAGFSALALEKTMSNFLTACANTHLGLWAWDGLVFLRKLLLEHASNHI